MKKHAKKSLLIPILALVSVVAIAACCYLAQSFNAFADVEAEAVIGTTEEQVLPEGENPDPDGTLLEGEEENVSIRTVVSKIQFSDPVEYLYGSIETNDGTIYPFFPTTELVHVFNDIAIIETPRASIKSNEVIIAGIPNGDKVHIQIPLFKYCEGVTLNGIDDTHVDINVVIGNTYKIGFDANGGKFVDGSTFIYVDQLDLEIINMPSPMMMQSASEHGRFSGWYTERFGGERVFDRTQCPEWGTYFVLYAHWARVDGPSDQIDFHFTTDSFYKQFDYVFYFDDYNDTQDIYNSGEIASGKTSNLNLSDLYKDPDGAPFSGNELNGSHDCGFGYGNAGPYIDVPDNILGKIRYGLGMSLRLDGTFTYVENDTDDFHEVTIYLVVTSLENQHIDGATGNGQILPDNGVARSVDNGNNVIISTSGNVPGYIGIASDDGSFFKCRYMDNKMSEPSEFVSDYVPIFVGADEVVAYAYVPYGSSRVVPMDNADDLGLLANQGDTYGFGLEIMIAGPDSMRMYFFQNNIFTLFDWFDINSYIKGISLDGDDLRAGSLSHRLQNGYHNFVLRMSDKEADTTVTYDANGGHFADDSTTMTLDATFGEALPLVENPVAIDNDFVGWFTEPEGGVQVDPANYHWMPWDRWDGVKLYAHWAYNPQPVPPEPVPPTPDPVNPDVPGGGGAQTGDSMPLVPIAALAVIAALGCGLAIRKEYF